jgi:hypothetical protein
VTLVEAAWIAWAALAAALGKRWLEAWDRQAPPAPPSIFDRPEGGDGPPATGEG